MTTKASGRYWSDAAVPPGEFLADELDAVGMTQQELALRTDRPAQAISEIIHGKKQITFDTAIQLEKVLGIPAYIWTELESTYQLTRAREREAELLREQEDWLKVFPVREMEKRGWIETKQTKQEKVGELLRFLGVASFAALRQQQRPLAGYSISPRAKVSEESLRCWVRKGEIDGHALETGVYDEQKFRAALHELRELTNEQPASFFPRMRTLCADAGVAVVVVEHLPKSGAQGVSRWLTPTKALIQVSVRYTWGDIFWFSFFHEAKHILDQRVREIIVDGLNNRDDSHEKEANEFARDLLILPEVWRPFVVRKPRSFREVKRFARDVGIDPGIVVGRLQNEKVIPPTNLNSLRSQFKIVPEQESA